MRLKKGDLVEIEFLDHVEDGAEPLRFRVYGRVAVNGRRHFEVLSWAYADRDEGGGDPNEKRFTIVKSAINHVRKLTYEQTPLAEGPR